MNGPRTDTAAAKRAGGENASGAGERAPDADGLDRDALVQLAAYYLYVGNGSRPGHALEDWIAAEAMVDERLEAARQSLAAAPTAGMPDGAWAGHGSAGRAPVSPAVSALSTEPAPRAKSAPTTGAAKTATTKAAKTPRPGKPLKAAQPATAAATAPARQAKKPAKKKSG